MANSSSTSLTTTSSARLGSASPSTSVICQEVFDDFCQPSSDEINEYALIIGIDPAKEQHLLYLAREGLMQALPTDWKICYSEEKCGHYYVNSRTKQTQWDHPLDAVYRELVQQARNRQHAASSAITPVVDISEDASQLDSGIRSLQGNEEADNTNNTNDMSSPVGKELNNTAANGAQRALGPALNQSAQNSNSTSTSGFSGGISRFLESRNKTFVAPFQAGRNSRFEVAKINPQISLGMKFAVNSEPNHFNSKLGTVTRGEVNDAPERKGGFTLSGTGAMFLKSRRQVDQPVNVLATKAHNNCSSMPLDAAVSSPAGNVKGILRDSSLTDMRRRIEKEEQQEIGTALGAEDKKSVRFNLEESKIRNSPEDDGNNSRKLTQSPEASINSDNDDDDDDPWDFDDDDDGVIGIGHLVSDAIPRSLNPFLMHGDKQLKDIKVISVPKAQTIQMLKAQSFSMDLPDREHAKIPDLARSQSVEASVVQPINAVTYLDKLKDNSVVKPLYEDTDSDSKGSSVRSFIINKSESEHQSTAPNSNNPFDLDELGRKHSRDVEQLEIKLQNVVGAEKTGLRSLKVASKLVGFLKKDAEKIDADKLDTAKAKISCTEEQLHNAEEIKTQMEQDRKSLFKEARESMEEQLQQEIDAIKREHEQKLKNIRHEYELRLASHQHELDEAMDLQLEEYRSQLEEELDMRRKVIVDEHKTQMDTLQKNHNEILQDLERDLKSEEELIKKEHVKKLAEIRDKVTKELEQERQRMRENGDDRLFEKVRCEKRLLEDKYRCLKEKYIRLKTDVKLSLERRNKRREAQQMLQQSLHTTTTTNSETERSISNKRSICNSENRSITQSLSYPEQGHSMDTASTTTPAKGIKPPVPPKSHLTVIAKDLPRMRDKSAERAQGPLLRKPGIASKYIKHLQVNDDGTSISQSDTTISNNYSKGRYLTPPHKNSDNGNSDSEAYNQENNNNAGSNGQRQKVFSRLKSASTSRLNSENYKHDRPCTPVENLRHQLQKLEDLEDQFPDNTLETTYHLRYPFSDISNEQAGGGSSELEFFKHRIHLERDSVRRAKESLRNQRTNFRARQREIKQRHKATVTRHSLDQLIQEEKELTEMEVNLHRTRALLGEKVIRLRHLEQSLIRVYEKDKPSTDTGMEPKEDATLSDLSSHSSSGFSSTDFASGADMQNLNKRKDIYQQDSSECIQNLEILNAEIREILDILGKNQQHSGMPVPIISPSELNWSNLAHSSQAMGSAGNFVHAPQSIPTLADRLETYRQLTTGRMQSSMGGAILAANTIVSQSPRAVNYTTSLVERTRDLRNWLRQAKNEHDLLTGLSGPLGLNLSSGSLGMSAGVLGATTNVNVSAGNSGTQTNL